MPISPARWIAHLEKNIETARIGDDPEGVHQVRVAARRLDAWLRIAGRRALRDDLRFLRDVAGRARDLDVMLLRDDLDTKWRAAIARERGDIQPLLVAVLSHPRVTGLTAALRVLPVVSDDQAADVLHRLFAKLVRRGDLAEGDPSLDRLHSLRRAVRQVRFGFEYTRRSTQLLVALQDSLGALSDAVVVREIAALHPDEGRRVAIEASCDEEIEAVRQSAVITWKSARSALLETRA